MKAEHMQGSTQQTPPPKTDSPDVQNIEVGGVIVPKGPSIVAKESDKKEGTKSSKGRKSSTSKEMKTGGNQN